MTTEPAKRRKRKHECHEHHLLDCIQAVVNAALGGRYRIVCDSPLPAHKAKRRDTVVTAVIQGRDPVTEQAIEDLVDAIKSTMVPPKREN